MSAQLPMSVNRPHFNIPFNPMHPKLPTPEQAAATRAYCHTHGMDPKPEPPSPAPAKRPKNQLKHHWQQGHRMARTAPIAAPAPPPPPLPPPAPEPILPRGGQSAAMPLTAPITQPAATPPPP